MSIERMNNQTRMQAARMMGQWSKGRWGLIDAYDPNAYAAKIKFMPDEQITGWLPLPTAFVGNGYGLQFGPQVGDMAFVEFAEGDAEAGAILCFGFNDTDRPLPVPAGEAWLTHQTGSTLRLLNDGSATFTTHTDLNATVGGKLNANVTGDLNATVGGNATAKIGGTADLEISGSATAKAASWAVTGDITLQGNLTQTGNLTVTGNLTQSGGSVSLG